MTTNHQEFARLADELQPDPVTRRTIVGLAETISDEGLRAVECAHTGDADAVIRHAAYAAAHCYQLVAQLGGDLDEELERLREELRAGVTLLRAFERHATEEV